MTLQVVTAALQSGAVRPANPASRRPSQSPHAKVAGRLSPATIKAICDEYRAGTGVTQNALAKKYGISQKTVQRIVRRNH